MRIGIVDEPRHAELLQLAIQLGGEHQVAWLVDSEAALAGRTGGGVPDLVLLNVDLPSVDGQAATRRLVSAGTAVLVMAPGQADPAQLAAAQGR